jgi:hypothetical protein
MSRWLLLGVLLLTGCDNLVGPFRRTPTRVDDPRLSTAEQQKLGRQYLGYPDDSDLVAPNSGILRPGSGSQR